MDNTGFYDNRILDLLPDGVIAVDRDLTVRRINPAACRFLSIRDTEEPVGGPVSRIMDDAAFSRLRSGEENTFSDTIELRGGDLRLECTYQRDAESTLFVCVMRNLSTRRLNEELLRSHLQAAELADAMCEKHLHLVQEIAGLLGEGAVEMQSSIRELKNTLLPGKGKQNG